MWNWSSRPVADTAAGAWPADIDGVPGIPSPSCARRAPARAAVAVPAVRGARTAARAVTPAVDGFAARDVGPRGGLRTMDRRTSGLWGVAALRVVAVGAVGVRDERAGRAVRASVAAPDFSAETILVSRERFLAAGRVRRERGVVDGPLTDERAASRRAEPLRAIGIASHTLHGTVPHGVHYNAPAKMSKAGQSGLATVRHRRAAYGAAVGLRHPTRKSSMND